MKQLSIENRNELGEALDRLEITQRKLASQCDISTVHLSRIMTGHTCPSLKLLAEIADKLGLRIDLQIIQKST